MVLLSTYIGTWYRQVLSVLSDCFLC